MKSLGMLKVVGVTATLLLAAGTANALSLVAGAQPAGSTSLFNAVGTFNYGNNKARLEAAGQTIVQGGNPGNGWWGDNDPLFGGLEPVRSWEVIWNNTAGTATFNVFTSSDWTGAAAMTMAQTPTFTAGNVLVGLDIGARLTSTAQSVVLGNVQFDDGSGFVPVPTANATYNANAFFNNFHALTGTLGNFTLRGTTQFPTGYVTSDNMRFFVNGLQAPVIPVPAAVWLFGSALGLMGVMRRRSKE